MPDHKVLRKNAPRKQEVRDALAHDWSLCFPPSVRGTAADHMACSRGTVDNGASGKHIPELHTALASLLANPSALQTTLALYGCKIVPLQSNAGEDMLVVSSMSHIAGRWVEALSDGQRDHQETLQLADAIRSVLPALSSICSEADRLRGVPA
jgi:hypothetical protein